MVLGNFSEQSLPQREFYGPPLLVREAITASQLYDTSRSIGSMSLYNILTSHYGEEGKGWEVDASRYDTVDHFKVNTPETSFGYGNGEAKLASSQPRYDVLLYPDGQQFAEEEMRRAAKHFEV